MKLFLTTNRLISLAGKLWDSGSASEDAYELPATDEDVRRDINMLLTRHEQREIPPTKPVKEKKTKASKAIKEDKCE